MLLGATCVLREGSGDPTPAFGARATLMQFSTRLKSGSGD